MKFIKRLLIAVVVLGAAAAFAYFYFYKDVPSYKESKNLRLLSFTKDKIAAAVDVVCHNPNRVGLKLMHSDFDVYANGKEACKVKQNHSSDIPAQSDFTIPLTISFSPLKVFKPVDLLASSFESLKSKKIDLRYSGIVTVGLAGQGIDIPVDFSDYLSLKKEK